MRVKHNGSVAIKAGNIISALQGVKSNSMKIQKNTLKKTNKWEMFNNAILNQITTNEYFIGGL